MKRKIKTWLIHKLGGYTADEATPNRKIQQLAMTHRYTLDMHRMYPMDVHAEQREMAKRKFLYALMPHVTIRESRDVYTQEWLLRLSINVVDNDLM